ncbi:MAG: riboflavin biosynthesis protein RibF [Coriobacteriaceae bacterium]|nr:riboflavin biosynthesis protein RibF [Coriobacteriaceae bacterium]
MSASHSGRASDLAERLRRDFIIGGAPAPIRTLARGSDARAVLPAVIAIGAFDGLHRGHGFLIDRAVADARARGIAAVAVTFDPDPDAVVAPRPAPKLLTTTDRLRALALSGVDAVVVVPFTRELASLGHAEFFDDVLARALDVRSIHVGADFRLGSSGASTVDVIRSWGAARGVDVFGHDLVREGAGAITATRIRGLIGAGELEAARELLGRGYYVRGCVVRGRGEGTGMGFPTANVARSRMMQMPPDGVYEAWALTDAGEAWPAAVNVGLPPMFSDDPSSSSLEATLLGFAGNLYGQGLAVLFERRLRPSVGFGSRDELIAAVTADIEGVRERFGDRPVAL